MIEVHDFGLTNFEGLLDYSHDHIHMQCMANLNDLSEQLAFIVNGEK
jgi:hypothetical protein